MANPNHNLYRYLLECNQGHMNDIALSTPNGRLVTYEELHDRVELYKKMLIAKGVRPGDKIGVCALNCPEAVFVIYALADLDVITIGLSPLAQKAEIQSDIAKTRPKMIVSVDMMYSNFKKSAKALDISTILYSAADVIDDAKLRALYKGVNILKGNFILDKNSNLKYLEELNYDDIVVPIENFYKPGDLSDILFTGGSTGVHKGTALSAYGLNYVVEGMKETFIPDAGMVELGHIPLGHMAYGKMILHFALCTNMNFAMTLKAEPKDFYDELVRTGAGGAVGGPPHWTSLIEKKGDIFVPRKDLVPGSLKNLHYATSGGEALKSATYDAICEALDYCGSDAVLGDGLGATETWAAMMANNGKCTIGTFGKPVKSLKVKLVDEKTNEIVERGKPGVLHVSGPQVMLEYYNNPEETSKVIYYDEDGTKWANIGDILQENENGEYKYIGRIKRNFVCGIVNVYSEDLESIITSLPGVKEAVVIPIPDDELQFIPKAHISIEPNVDTNKLEKQLAAILVKNRDASWIPRLYEYYYKPLERMANSKIDITYYRDKDAEKINGAKVKKM